MGMTHSNFIDPLISVKLVPGLGKRVSITEELRDGRKIEIIVQTKQLDELIGDLQGIRESLNPEPMFPPKV
jgi:hypothetical protein